MRRHSEQRTLTKPRLFLVNNVAHSLKSEDPHGVDHLQKKLNQGMCKLCIYIKKLKQKEKPLQTALVRKMKE